ncbi:MAG TPA: hypothetical protein V6D08_04840 [Candidatus Obscuribacterales bacterium]
MITTWAVQVTAYQIIYVIAVWNSIMPAARTVNMGSLMAAARVVRRAVAGVGGRFRQIVVVDVIIVHVMQMTIMQVVSVTIVLDSGVSARSTMLVLVSSMRGASHASFLRESRTWVYALLSFLLLCGSLSMRKLRDLPMRLSKPTAGAKSSRSSGFDLETINECTENGFHCPVPW